ncbi:MAG: 6,7-dimethyl-8-ribityllumazine synthase [Saprospiraceae bacterium]
MPIKKNKNLSETHQSDMLPLQNSKIGIVTAQWNQNITFSMRDACLEELKKYGLTETDIISYEVPGAFELPIAAKMLLSGKSLDAVICIGCVIKGETKHDEYISNAVASGIMTLSIVSGKPIIFGVLTPNDMQQAMDRSGGAHGNKGIEAAHTAIKMIHMAKDIKSTGKKNIGF